MKPAVAVAPLALKVPTVAHAAARSMKATAAPRHPGQRKPPVQEENKAKQSFGKDAAAAAAKEKLKSAKHRAI